MHGETDADITILPLLFVSDIVYAFRPYRILRFGNISISLIDNLQAIANIPMQCSDSNPVLSITQRNTPKTGAILTGYTNFSIHLIEIRRNPFHIQGKGTAQRKHDSTIRYYTTFNYEKADTTFRQVGIELIHTITKEQP